MKKTLISITAILMIYLIACNNESEKAGEKPAAKASAEKTTFKIGLGPWIGFGPFYLAQEKGFFKEQNVAVELITVTGLAERNSALRSNRIQGLAAPVDYFVLSAGNGLPMQVVMAIDESTGGDGMVAKKSIKSIKDLKGKRIAFQRGLPSEFFTRVLLKENGISLNDLTYTDMETADAGAAFISNSLDAATVWEPWLSKALDKGDSYIIASTKDHPNLIVDCLAFTPETVKNSPDDVKKIIDALLKAIDYWKQHPAEANEIMAPHFEVDAKKYALILSGANFCDLQRNKSFFGDAVNKGLIYQTAQKASDIWLEAGVIKKEVASDEIINQSFLK
jgi:NitT/TauT family transport system substrate-binding protein